jgi:hypothetical protein
VSWQCGGAGPPCPGCSDCAARPHLQAWEIDETFAWRNAGHLTARTPAYGIAACWARLRWQLRNPGEEDTLWDRSICREIRGDMAWHAFAHQVGARLGEEPAS